MKMHRHQITRVQLAKPALDHAASTLYLHTSTDLRASLLAAQWAFYVDKKVFKMEIYRDKLLKTNWKK